MKSSHMAQWNREANLLSLRTAELIFARLNQAQITNIDESFSVVDDGLSGFTV